MATMLRSSMATRCASRQRVVRCEAGLKQVQLAGAAAMAAAAILAAPAQAGVVLQQPALKKAFQEPEPVAAAAASTSAAPAAKAAPAPKKEASSSSEGDLDVRSIALPGSIIFVGGLAFAARAVDQNFDEFLKYTLIKDNNEDGVGYENTIKATAGGIYGPPEGRAGTKKVQKKKK